MSGQLSLLITVRYSPGYLRCASLAFIDLSMLTRYYSQNGSAVQSNSMAFTCVIYMSRARKVFFFSMVGNRIDGVSDYFLSEVFWC